MVIGFFLNTSFPKSLLSFALFFLFKELRPLSRGYIFSINLLKGNGLSKRY